MSSTSTRGIPEGNQQRELVLCHQCQDEWYRDEHGLVCPSCGSDFVEIVCLPSLSFLHSFFFDIFTLIFFIPPFIRATGIPSIPTFDLFVNLFAIGACYFC